MFNCLGRGALPNLEISIFFPPLITERTQRPLFNHYTNTKVNWFYYSPKGFYLVHISAMYMILKCSSTNIPGTTIELISGKLEIIGSDRKWDADILSYAIKTCGFAEKRLQHRTEKEKESVEKRWQKASASRSEEWTDIFNSDEGIVIFGLPYYYTHLRFLKHPTS